jgi:hypothetical protein
LYRAESAGEQSPKEMSSRWSGASGFAQTGGSSLDDVDICEVQLPRLRLKWDGYPSKDRSYNLQSFTLLTSAYFYAAYISMGL